MKEPYFNIYPFLYEISSSHKHIFNHVKDLLHFLCTVIKGNKRTWKLFKVFTVFNRKQ